MAHFHYCGDDYAEQSFSRAGITVEGNYKSSHQNSVRSNSISASQSVSIIASTIELSVTSSRATGRGLPRLGIEEGLKPPNLWLVVYSDIPQQFAVLVFDELRPAVSLAFQVIVWNCP